MIDDRELLERALRRFEPDPGLAERVMRRRDRKRRNQRISAGALGIAIVIAGVVAVATVAGTDPVPADTVTPAPTDERVGFIGVPPEGAQPSTPVTGDLVLSLDTTVSGGDPYKTTLYVYADGRMIWERHAGPTGVPEGAREQNTGYLEQVLSPEGIEALRREILASGLFEEDLHLRGGWEDNPDIYGTGISVLVDDGMVSLAWAGGYDDDRHPTSEEMDAIRGLVQRIRDPAAWLPETAWADVQIRPYVASNYWVGFSLVTKPDGDCCLHPDPSALPPPAEEILTTKFNQCLTADEARRLAEGFEAAGIAAEEGFGFGAGVEYDTGITGGDGMTQLMSLYPALPDWSC